jgi:hypothetical protein
MPRAWLSPEPLDAASLGMLDNHLGGLLSITPAFIRKLLAATNLYGRLYDGERDRDMQRDLLGGHREQLAWLSRRSGVSPIGRKGGFIRRIFVHPNRRCPRSFDQVFHVDLLDRAVELERGLMMIVE